MTELERIIKELAEIRARERVLHARLIDHVRDIEQSRDIDRAIEARKSERNQPLEARKSELNRNIGFIDEFRYGVSSSEPPDGMVYDALGHLRRDPEEERRKEEAREQFRKDRW